MQLCQDTGTRNVIFMIKIISERAIQMQENVLEIMKKKQEFDKVWCNKAVAQIV